jgi:hypothetical protein
MQGRGRLGLALLRAIRSAPVAIGGSLVMRAEKFEQLEVRTRKRPEWE